MLVFCCHNILLLKASLFEYFSLRVGFSLRASFLLGSYGDLFQVRAASEAHQTGLHP